MNKLEQFTKKVFGVISLKDVADVKKFQEELYNHFISDTTFTEFYFILHKETDTLHIHYLIDLSKRIRLGTLINTLASYTGLNTLAISAQKCSSKCASLRYMIHSDNNDKVQYLSKDIISNMSLDYIDDLMKKNDDDELNFDRLVFIVKDNNFSEFKIMSVLGLKTYHKYRYEIKTLIDCNYQVDQYYESKHNNLDL